jgi:hypothetical protein
MSTKIEVKHTAPTKEVDVAKEAMTEVFASLKGNARQDAKAVLGTLREIVKNVRLVPGDKIREWLVARIDNWMMEIDSVGEMTKTEVKHTAGPWNVGGHWQDDEDTIYSGTMALARALKSREHVGTPIEQFDANARLIAAAPDLLEALEAIINHDSEEDSEGNIVIRFNCAEWLVFAMVARKARGE